MRINYNSRRAWETTTPSLPRRHVICETILTRSRGEQRPTLTRRALDLIKLIIKSSSSSVTRFTSCLSMAMTRLSKIGLVRAQGALVVVVHGRLGKKLADGRRESAVVTHDPRYHQPKPLLTRKAPIPTPPRLNTGAHPTPIPIFMRRAS